MSDSSDFPQNRPTRFVRPFVGGQPMGQPGPLKRLGNRRHTAAPFASITDPHALAGATTLAETEMEYGERKESDRADTVPLGRGNESEPAMLQESGSPAGPTAASGRSAATPPSALQVNDFVEQPWNKAAEAAAVVFPDLSPAEDESAQSADLSRTTADNADESVAAARWDAPEILKTQRISVEPSDVDAVSQISSADGHANGLRSDTEDIADSSNSDAGGAQSENADDNQILSAWQKSNLDEHVAETPRDEFEAEVRARVDMFVAAPDDAIIAAAEPSDEVEVEARARVDMFIAAPDDAIIATAEPGEMVEAGEDSPGDEPPANIRGGFLHEASIGDSLPTQAPVENHGRLAASSSGSAQSIRDELELGWVDEHPSDVRSPESASSDAPSDQVGGGDDGAVVRADAVEASLASAGDGDNAEPPQSLFADSQSSESLSMPGTFDAFEADLTSDADRDESDLPMWAMGGRGHSATLDVDAELDALVAEGELVDHAVGFLETIARQVRSGEIVLTPGSGASAESVLASVLAQLLSRTD